MFDKALFYNISISPMATFKYDNLTAHLGYLSDSKLIFRTTKVTHKYLFMGIISFHHKRVNMGFDFHTLWADVAQN